MAMENKVDSPRILRRQDHRDREDLTQEHPFGDAGQIALACLFGALWIADTFVFKYTTFLNGWIPLGFRVVPAALVLGLSAYLARAGLSIVFKEVREKPEVIRKGVFGVVRHPIYLSEILLYLGLLILSLSLAAAFVWFVAIAFLHRISRYEERLLLERFGNAYGQYMRDIPMWVPRLSLKTRA
jgi:protein-S-isoprenylcysteine O-methyltransferase Ste14